jgi:hypothetical protein
MEYSAKARLPLQLYQYYLSFALLMNFHSYPFTKGDRIKASKVSSFLALNTKGGEINRPKAKGPHHHPVFKNFFKKGERLFKLQNRLDS